MTACQEKYRFSPEFVVRASTEHALLIRDFLSQEQERVRGCGQCGPCLSSDALWCQLEFQYRILRDGAAPPSAHRAVAAELVLSSSHPDDYRAVLLREAKEFDRRIGAERKGSIGRRMKLLAFRWSVVRGILVLRYAERAGFNTSLAIARLLDILDEAIPAPTVSSPVTP